MSRLWQSGYQAELRSLSVTERQPCRSDNAGSVQSRKLVHLMRMTMVDKNIGQNQAADLEASVE